MKKDKRINASSFSIKQYLLFFLALIAICGVYTKIIMDYVQSDVTYSKMGAFTMVGFLLLISFAICLVSAFIKRQYVDSPVHKLRIAATQIAQGDFSVRLPPHRKDNKKDEMTILYEDFNKMAEELAGVETLKTDFISSVSHEIKTPIAVIQNYASFLQSESLSNEERMEYAKIVVQASRRLSDLVNDILNMNKLEHLEIVPQGSLYSLDDQLRRCVVTFEDLWASKDIVWSAELEEVSVCYDESMTQLLWNNLISNAVKFTEPGGEIMLSLFKEKGFVVASVKDNGCGMDEQTALHIFDKFYQGDTSHAKEGNGLGLAMVKKVIGILGGEISVESQPGVGSTFTVKLKL